MTGLRHDRSRLIGLWAGVVLGIGFISGLSVRQLADDSGAKAEEPAQDGQSADESPTESTEEPSNPDAVEVSCQVVGSHGAEVREPEFIAGIEEAGIGELANQLDLASDVFSFGFDEYDGDPERFNSQVLARASERRGVLVVQKGQKQRVLADAFKTSEPASRVVAVLPEDNPGPLGYPAGTVVMLAPGGQKEASLDTSTAAFAARVIRGEAPCTPTQSSQNPDDETVNERSQS